MKQNLLLRILLVFVSLIATTVRAVDLGPWQARAGENITLTGSGGNGVPDSAWHNRVPYTWPNDGSYDGTLPSTPWAILYTTIDPSAFLGLKVSADACAYVDSNQMAYAYVLEYIPSKGTYYELGAANISTSGGAGLSVKNIHKVGSYWFGTVGISGSTIFNGPTNLDTYPEINLGPDYIYLGVGGQTDEWSVGIQYDEIHTPVSTPIPLYIDAQSPSKTYDGSNLTVSAPTVRASSPLSSPSHYIDIANATTAVGPNVGDYITTPGSVTVKTTALGKVYDVTWMYDIKLVNGTAHIVPAPVTFTVAPVSFTYNATPQGPAITASPAAASWSVTSGQTSATNAGSYSVTTTANGNYTGTKTTSWVIAKADQPAPTLSGNPLTIIAGKTSTLTPSGGLGTGGWEYQITSGTASISGNTLTSPIAGTVGVHVRRLGDANYNVSPWSNTVTIQVISNTYTLTVATDGSGTATGAGSYTSGSTASVAATPSSGWEFDRIDGAVTSSSNPTSIIMDSDKTVTVHFRQSAFILTTSVSGDGAITPGGTYSAGTWVTITATPTATSRFLGFTGDLTGTTNPQNLQMSAPKNVVANFAAKLPQTIVFPNPSPVQHDTAVALTATASSGLPVSYSIISGSGTLSGTTLYVGAAGTITVKADQAGDAVYLPAPSVVIDISVWGDAKVNIESQGPDITTSNDESKGPGQLIIKP